MGEIIPTYQLKDPDQVMPMDRAEFYDEQEKVFHETGKATRATEIIDVLLFNPRKEAILQKRSKFKRHNPSLYDKSIGGHVTFGDTAFFTVQAETLQELSVPAIVISDTEDFKKNYRVLKDYLDRSALIQLVDSRIASFKKIMNGKEVQIAKRYHFFVGVYGGLINPSDAEAAGVMYYSMDDLEEEMKNHPDIYTGDLHFYLSKYRAKISDFLTKLD